MAAGAADDAAGTAAAQARGHVSFLGLELCASPGALVPRAETELLATTALAALTALETDDPRVIDVCCGVGNLAVAIAHAVPRAHVWALDLGAPAVETARRNVAAYDLSRRVTVAQGDLFAPLTGLGLEASVHMVVCNPPYISSGRLAGDRAHLLEHEPREAFDAGPYGLTIHQRVIREAPAYLQPTGWLLVEFGAGQHQQVRTIFDRTRRYGPAEFSNDPAGVPRVAGARLRG